MRKTVGMIVAAFVMFSGQGYAAGKEPVPGKWRLDYEYTERLTYERKQGFSVKNEIPEVPLPPYGGRSYHRDERIDTFKKALSLESSTALSGVAQAGAAVVSNFVLHEAGHAVVAEYAGAQGTRYSFFTRQNNQFFIGLATYRSMDERSGVPFSMGGEVASDITFEYALESYRRNPTVYDKALLLMSGTDLLRYCVYAFYLTDGHPYYDPVAVSRQTGISRNVIFSVALAKTMIDAYRVYSGRDFVIPYFTVDKYSAVFNLSKTF